MAYKNNVTIGKIILTVFLESGFYDREAVRKLLKECSRMYSFNHPNVLSLSGVCLDGGPAPYIIMPLMANGSLLNHLKKNRDSLVISSDNTGSENDCVNVSATIIACNNNNYYNYYFSEHGQNYINTNINNTGKNYQQATDGYVSSNC